MSLTLERALSLPTRFSDGNDSQEQDLSADSRLQETIEIGNVKYTKAIEYVKGQSTEALGGGSASSVFEAGTPGAMTLREVESSIDLGLWNLAIGNNVVKLEVCKNLSKNRACTTDMKFHRIL